MDTEYKGFKIELNDDSIDAESPRDFESNMTIMAAFHGRYNLGDKPEIHGYKSKDYYGWDEMEKAIRRKEGDIVLMEPLYLMDHSGITISTSSFSCPWDSGQVGFVYVTKRKIRENYGVKNVTKKQIARAEKELASEVEIYDTYIRGEVYRYSITAMDGTDEEIDSCGPYYGSDEAEKAAKEAIDCHIRFHKTPSPEAVALVSLN